MGVSDGRGGMLETVPGVCRATRARVPIRKHQAAAKVRSGGYAHHNKTDQGRAGPTGRPAADTCAQHTHR